MKPDMSVIICTYNRCESLRDTLRAIKRQKHLENLSVEIIVVDNNSTDRTAEVIRTESKESRWPILYFFEANQGKSYALNRAIHEAKADFLAFTDDDVIPAENWLQALWDGASAFQADCVGGPVIPLWSGEPPPWLQDQEMRFGILALLDRGDKPFLANEEADGNFVIGANVAFRRSAFHDFGLYRTDLGPKGTELGRADDSEMLKRLLRAKKRILYTPDAVVQHKVGKERLTKKYLRKWQFDAGKSFARISGRSAGMPRWLIRECLESGIAAVWCYFRRDHLEAVRKEEEFWNKLGMLSEMRKK